MREMEGTYSRSQGAGHSDEDCVAQNGDRELVRRIADRDVAIRNYVGKVGGIRNSYAPDYITCSRTHDVYAHGGS